MSKQTEKLFTSKDFDKEPKSPSENIAKNPPQEPTPNAPKSKTWLWILIGVGVIVLAIIAFFVFSGDKKDSEGVSEENIEVVEEVETYVADTTDETPTEAAVEPDATGESQDVSEVSNEQSVPGTSITSQQEKVATSAPQPQASNVSSDVEVEAMKVIRGDYGIGQERKNKLGDKYQTIQSRVNELKREGVF